jgi:hypothetical protein
LSTVKRHRHRRTSAVNAFVVWTVLCGIAPAAALIPVPVSQHVRHGPLPGALPVAVCGRLQPIPLDSGGLMCTHGADPAPPGIDPSVPRPLAGGPHPEGLLFPDPPGSSPSTAKAEPGIACYGNGQDGKRVQAVYAVPADRPDRFDEVIGSIRQWAADVDAVFQASAAKTGGVRRIRFVTDGACNLDVQHVRLTATGDDTFENTIAEFSAQGLNASDRKYLVWMDSTVLCGIATYYVDDRKTSENLNNGRSGVPGSIARTDSGCWGLGARGQSIEAHELMHSLGAVQPTAPHASPAGHCSDSADRMCYQDGTVLRLLNTCSTDHGAMFDCGSDDYFSTAPRAGNYLAARWNTADNAFLSSDPSEIGVPVPPSVPPPPPPPPQPPSLLRLHRKCSAEPADRRHGGHSDRPGLLARRP